jgi:DNA-binding response OmpR family regulator
VTRVGRPLAAPTSPVHPRSARVHRLEPVDAVDPAYAFDPAYTMAEAHDFYGDSGEYSEAHEPRMLRCGDLVLDESRWTVHRAGTPVDLSPTEFRLLACLMRHQGSVLSRTQLLQHVWGGSYTGQAQVVETYVSAVQIRAVQIRAALTSRCG